MPAFLFYVVTARKLGGHLTGCLPPGFHVFCRALEAPWWCVLLPKYLWLGVVFILNLAGDTVRFDVSGLTTYMKNHLFFSGKSYHIDKPCAVLVALWHFFILLTNVTGVLWQNCLHLGGASVRWGALGNWLYYQSQLLCSLIWMMLSLHFPKCESAWPYTFSHFGVKKANSNSSGQGREKYILNLFWVILFPLGLGGFGHKMVQRPFC